MTEFLGESHEVRKGLWTFFLDRALWALIDWASKLRSYGVFRRRRYNKVPSLCIVHFLYLCNFSVGTPTKLWKLLLRPYSNATDLKLGSST